MALTPRDELERLLPWSREAFRTGLAGLRASREDAARRLAADLRLIASLAAQVPRSRGDERGATPWTSFLREVAVACQLSDRAAIAHVRMAVRLRDLLPVLREELEAGRVCVARAQALARELEPYDDELATLLDAELGPRAGSLAPSRMALEVRRAAARRDPGAAAARRAVKDADRDCSVVADADDQASAYLTGPAVPLQRWHAGLDERARALRSAGDPRTLAQLRFDLATSQTPCLTHVPAAADAAAEPTTGGPLGPVGAAAVAGQRSTFVEQADTDCRLSRPVQATVLVPVETALGLAQEPGWLVGHGWVSAPTCRELLVDAELRRACVQSGTGELVHVDDRLVRHRPDPDSLRAALVRMVREEVPLVAGQPADTGTPATPTRGASTETPAVPGAPATSRAPAASAARAAASVATTAWRTEEQHDPSTTLTRFVRLRDLLCDGPTQALTASSRCDLDHDLPWPDGPTAAWNLTARGRRTHLLKHADWIPERTTTSTIWTSPAGQTVEVPRTLMVPPRVGRPGGVIATEGATATAGTIHTAGASATGAIATAQAVGRAEAMESAEAMGRAGAMSGAATSAEAARPARVDDLDLDPDPDFDLDLDVDVDLHLDLDLDLSQTPPLSDAEWELLHLALLGDAATTAT